MNNVKTFIVEALRGLGGSKKLDIETMTTSEMGEKMINDHTNGGQENEKEELCECEM